MLLKSESAISFKGDEMRRHTDGLDRDVYARAHDLVPAEYSANIVSAIRERGHAAEWMCEGGIGGEVRLERVQLL